MRKPRSKLIPLTTALATLSLSLQPLQTAWAANHPNSQVTNTNVINLTANVDWDYDGPAPLQSGSTTQRLTKEVLRNQILREAARSIFLMTEGRHRVGNIYVYKNARFGGNVDIRMLNSSDRSYAQAAKWLQPEGSSFNFLAMDRKPEKLINYARVIAHELGHYVYGFADEYREANKALDPSALYQPSSADYTRTTMMHDHESFTRLSLAEDYAQGTATTNNNAQTRVYATDRANLRGGSHWEVLTRDPASDPATAQSFHNGERVWFDAFKNMTPPTAVASLALYAGVFCDPTVVSAACGTGDASRDQLVPVAERVGSESAHTAMLWAKSGGLDGRDAVDGAVGGAFESFKVLFADSPNPTALGSPAGLDLMRALGVPMRADGTPRRRLAATAAETSAATASRHVIVIDRSLPVAAFDEAKFVAEFLLELAPSGSLWSVVASPQAAGAAPAALQPIDTRREALLQAVQSLTRQDGRFDGQAAIALAQTQIAARRNEVDAATVELITAQGTTLPAAVGSAARQQRTAINAIGLQLAGGASGTTVSGGVTLSALARASGGQASNVRNGEQAAKAALRAVRKGQGEVFGMLAMDFDEKPAAGTRATAFTATGYDKVIGAYWTFDPADKARLNFRLVTPAGTFTTLSPDSDLDDGFALIELDNTAGRHNGAVRAETLSAAGVANPVAVDVQAESDIEMVADLEGGTLSDNRSPVLRVQLTGTAPVAKATVLATVYRIADGVPVLTDVKLMDDGIGADSRADDGSYAGNLDNLLPAGDYFIAVRAVTTADSVFQPNQIFAIGATVAVRPVGAGLTRVDEMDVTLEAGAKGVKTALAVPPAAGGGGAGSGTTTATAGGGGCTVIDGQRDAGLLILLGAAAFGLWLRRARPARDIGGKHS